MRLNSDAYFDSVGRDVSFKHAGETGIKVPGIAIGAMGIGAAAIGIQKITQPKTPKPLTAQQVKQAVKKAIKETRPGFAGL